MAGDVLRCRLGIGFTQSPRQHGRLDGALDHDGHGLVGQPAIGDMTVPVDWAEDGAFLDAGGLKPGLQRLDRAGRRHLAVRQADRLAFAFLV